ncbi:hypothetical protein [Ekhidna sp.]|uniref:hypothetical protein n=1 Tax=Ekhidna sp. TaxID=2608089 RepID=UPI003B5C690F
MENKGTLFLRNGLFGISRNYDELSHLESSTFEVLDEIDTCITVAFSKDSINRLANQKIINADLSNQLVKFGEFVNSIDPSLWNPVDFDESSDWDLARKWAQNLMSNLNLDQDKWDLSGSTDIYLDD